MKVIIPRAKGCQLSVITYRKQELKENLIIKCNVNLILDTRVYTSEFPGGDSVDVLANISADSILQSCIEYCN